MGGGGLQRIIKFLKYFDYVKYRVSVLTVKPSFFYSDDATLQQNVPEDVEIIRTGSLDPFRLIYLLKKIFRNRAKDTAQANQESGGIIRKIAAAIFIPDSRLLWLPFAVWHLKKLDRRDKIDMIFATMPPFTSGLIACCLKTFAKRTILDFRDAWTNNPYLPAQPSFAQKLSQKLERFCISRARGIVFINPALEASYLKKFPSVVQKPHLTIRNGYDPDDFPPLQKARQDHSDSPEPFELGIMGTVYSQGNCPETLIQAVKALSEESQNFSESFRLTFLGKWAPDFLRFVEESRLQEIVHFLPYRPHREALSRASQFDALSLSIDSNIAGSGEVTPGRIYEYLFLRKPVLAICPLESDLANLVRDCHAGKVIEYNNIDGIKETIRLWIDAEGMCRERYTFTNLDAFSRKPGTEKLLSFMHESF